MFTANEIRRKFIEYFKENGHEEVTSSSLVPKDDPSLYFANAGMVQFKKLFLGQEKRDYVRATTSQKCLRVSGKHNDLENVGRTARHHTFFEMLGNFSFGDYFKERAIELAWGFVTKELGLKEDKLYVTVYQDDEEAYNLWQKVAGLKADHIFRMGDKDNFWSMGDTGPCGPCSEIYVDQGEEMSCGENCGIGKCECDRFLEIWNLVFMQFDQTQAGVRTSLPHPSIDTGMGLERVTAICQGVRSNFDTDIFQELINYTASLANVKYAFSLPDTNDTDTALRVIADHSRSIAFLITDGVLPSNEGRGYVLRRLLRRAARFGHLIGFREPFLHKTCKKVVDIMGEDYVELVRRQYFMLKVVLAEEERFSLTLDKGLILLEDEFTALSSQNIKMLSGEFCFKLYDTYGFPLDIVRDISSKQGFSVDEEAFEANMQAQKIRARAGWKGSGEKDPASLFGKLLEDGLSNEFIGYDKLNASGRIVSLLDDQAFAISGLKEGQKGYLVTDQTVFYGASGGQSGDLGTIVAPFGKAQITDSFKPSASLIVSQIEVTKGEILLDQEIDQFVDEEARIASARHHSCTHLLHAALKKVLGSHVEQHGSLVSPDRLRFDFSHIKAMTESEIRVVENEVNRVILEDIAIKSENLSYDEAMQKGAVALFSEKYGKTVRVLTMGEQKVESMELCGGTHLNRSGQAGTFLILSESGISAGVRRIEALCGKKALEFMQEQNAKLAKISGLLKAPSPEIVGKIEGLQKEIKQVRKDLQNAQSQSLAKQERNFLEQAELINNVHCLCLNLGELPINAIRELMDDLRNQFTTAKQMPAVLCLVAKDKEKVNMLLFVSEELHSKYTAPRLIKELAPIIGGSGGGRPELAQAGGTKPEAVDEMFNALKKSI